MLCDVGKVKGKGEVASLMVLISERVLADKDNVEGLVFQMVRLRVWVTGAMASLRG